MNYNPIIRKQGDGKPIVSVIGSIHGDEKVGEQVVKALSKIKLVKGTLITVIGHPVALQKKKRFFDIDLNRAFPGKKNGKKEEKIAHQITKAIKHSDFVMDIHSTTTDTKDLAIIVKRNQRVKQLLKMVNPLRVTLMPLSFGKKSLINSCLAAVSFEYGKHNSKYAYQRSLEDAKKVLSELGMIKESSPKKKVLTEYFKILGTVKKPTGFVMVKNLKNFKLIKKGDVLGRTNSKVVLAQENFYPILFGPKAYKDIMGLKAKKIKKLV